MHSSAMRQGPAAWKFVDKIIAGIANLFASEKMIAGCNVKILTLRFFEKTKGIFFWIRVTHCHLLKISVIYVISIAN
jgi:hypothetical protein